MSNRSFGLVLAGLITSLALAAPAHAVTVTAQIEGAAAITGPTATTTTGAVTRGSTTCPDGSLVSVLDALTAGDWQGVDEARGSSFTDPASPGIIRGEEHQFSSGAYWAVYVNGLYVDGYPCTLLANAGDEVLWFAQDDPFVAGTGGYEEVVYLTGVPLVAKPGVPFTVTVRQSSTEFDQNFFFTSARLDPAEGATVGGATVGADGKATVTLTQRGPQTLVARKGNRAPDRTDVCVSDGSDGFCGTELAKQAEQEQAAAATCLTRGDDGLCGTSDKRASFGFITSLTEQQRFAKGKGPRELKGRVDADPSGLKQVRLRVTRRTGERCTTFDARTQAFVKAKCGAAAGKWFALGDRADWSYLLPAAMTRGRYVLDVEATDGAGNADTALARGRNRIVVHVG